MTDTDDRHQDAAELEERLRDVLGRSTDGPEIDPRVDSEIRELISARAAEIRDGAGVIAFPTWWRSAAAAAAVIAILGTLTVALVNRGGAPVAKLTTQSEDINRDGRIDILDAFVVAAALASASQPPDAWDLNADGAVDENDVERAAARAVALDAEEG